MYTIAILLTVHNRKEKTLKCLEYITSQLPIEGYTIDIYLTNDGCTDGTPQAISEQFPEVIIIHANGSLFWNRGMYTAWEKASKTKDCDFYLWLNDDVLIYPELFSMLLQTSKKYFNQAIIVGATQSSDHSKTTYGGRKMKGGLVTPQGIPAEVDFFNGNIVLIPKSVFQIVGNLDSFFTHGKGDFDYGLRARKAGIKIFQAPQYLGECDQHPSLEKWCNPTVSFRQRWKALHSPTGMPPKESFHLEKRHFGIISASFHYLTILLRCCFPKIWIYKRLNLHKN